MRLMVVVVMVVAGFVAVAWLFQGRLIYLPFGTAGSPSAAGLDSAEEVQLATDDGLELGAWFVPPATEATGAGVVMLPGNAGNRSLRAPLARELSEAGLAVLLVEYRGYAGNPGRPSEAGLATDARAAYAHLEQRSGIDRIVVFGESLGAAVAVGLARDAQLHALVLRSPFTALADVGRVHYPFLPVGLLLRDRFDVVEAVRDLDVPVRVVAGERDTIVPVEQSRRVARAAGTELVVVPSADHNDPALGAGDVVVDAIVAATR
jgi:uncharacterized protein